MFYTVITGICLVASGATPTASAQQPQNRNGGWSDAPPPPPPGGWPAIPPPPPPPPPPAGWPAPQPPTPASADCPLSSIVSGACPSENGATPTYLQSYLCGCFFECSNGVPYPFKCPATLQFNPLINVCADYSNECVIPATTTPAPTVPPTAPPTTPPTTATHPASELECPIEDVIEGLCQQFVDETYQTGYCSCFYRCADSVITPYKCPDGLKYNPSSDQCDILNDPDCTPVPTTTSPAQPPHPATLEECPKDYDPVCPPAQGPNAPTTYLPSVYCSCFYQCSNGVASPYKCPDDLQYNFFENECVFYDDPVCDPVLA